MKTKYSTKIELNFIFGWKKNTPMVSPNEYIYDRVNGIIWIFFFGLQISTSFHFFFVCWHEGDGKKTRVRTTYQPNARK